MDIKLLTQSGDYDLIGVQAGTVLFQFLPEERGTALLILKGLCEMTNYPPARAELERLIGIIDPSAHPDSATIN